MSDFKDSPISQRLHDKERTDSPDLEPPAPLNHLKDDSEEHTIEIREIVRGLQRSLDQLQVEVNANMFSQVVTQSDTLMKLQTQRETKEMKKENLHLVRAFDEAKWSMRDEIHILRYKQSVCTHVCTCVCLHTNDS